MVFCTCPDAAVAQRLAEAAVSARLAACVNRLPGIESVYEWQGQVERESEHLLIAKTRPECFDALAACWRGHHPYELPEIVAVPMTDGLPDYLAWINQQVDA